MRLTKYEVKILLSVHPLIKNLLWIEDGPCKNWNGNQNVVSYNVMGFVFQISYGAEEPSLISLKAPISFEDIGNVDPPGYYPSYKGLTPQQKGTSWNFLKDPFVGGFDISYVFILYYGLERHLYQGKYEEAADVVLRLRRIYDNASFQWYSTNAIVLTSLARKRPDFIERLYDERDSRLDSSLSADMLLLCKLGLKESLQASDLMALARSFGFTNTNYIKKYPDLFYKELSSVSIHNPIMLTDYLNEFEFTRLEKKPVAIYANYSIKNREMDIPAISTHAVLAEAVREQLQVAHDAVKEYLKQQRKAGKKIDEAPKKGKKKKEFDEEKERVLQAELLNADGYVNRHYALLNLHEFYYTYRDISPEYILLAEQYALEDISILPMVQDEYKSQRTEERRNYIRMNTGKTGKSELDRLFDLSFCYSVPAFKRLCIIYERDKRFQDAIDICDPKHHHPVSDGRLYHTCGYR